MQIHVQLDGAPSGPHNRDQIEALLAAGRVTGESLAWTPGMADWQPLSTLIPASAGLSAPEAGSGGALNPYSPPAHPGALPQPEYRTGPTGVGGWLLFYCISLTILSPLLSLVGVAISLSPLNPEAPAALLAGILVEVIGLLLIMLAGVIVGFRLWTRKPNAVRTVRAYLIARLIGIIALEGLSVLFMSSALTPEVMGSVTGAGIKLLLREILYFFVWYSYFKKSIRVANTFPEEAR